jgi:DNA-binding LacI/PurR family transcriptional regulator
MSGYEDALRDYGLRVQVLEDASQGKKSLEGFVCVNDYIAAQLIRSFLGAGTRVPRDISVVGIDDASYATLLPVPLTTVRQPTREIGEMALRTMLDRIDRPRGPARELLLDGQLVVRESSGAKPEGPDRPVSQNRGESPPLP